MRFMKRKCINTGYVEKGSLENISKFQQTWRIFLYRFLSLFSVQTLMRERIWLLWYQTTIWQSRQTPTINLYSLSLAHATYNCVLSKFRILWRWKERREKSFTFEVKNQGQYNSFIKYQRISIYEIYVRNKPRGK